MSELQSPFAIKRKRVTTNGIKSKISGPLHHQTREVLRRPPTRVASVDQSPPLTRVHTFYRF